MMKRLSVQLTMITLVLLLFVKSNAMEEKSMDDFEKVVVDQESEPLFIAIKEGDWHFCWQLLNISVLGKEKVKAMLRACDADGRTPLHKAVRSMQPNPQIYSDVINLLLNRAKELGILDEVVLARNRKGWAPLHEASMYKMGFTNPLITDEERWRLQGGLVKLSKEQEGALIRILTKLETILCKRETS